MLRIILSTVLQKCLLLSLIFYHDNLTLSYRKLSTVWQWAWAIEQTPFICLFSKHCFMLHQIVSQAPRAWKHVCWCGSRACGRARGQVCTAAKSSGFLSLVEPWASCLFWVFSGVWYCYNFWDIVCSVFCPELVKGWMLSFPATK